MITGFSADKIKSDHSGQQHYTVYTVDTLDTVEQFNDLPIIHSWLTFTKIPVILANTISTFIVFSQSGLYNL